MYFTLRASLNSFEIVESHGQIIPNTQIVSDN